MIRKLGNITGDPYGDPSTNEHIQYINFKLATMGLATYRSTDDTTGEGHHFIDLLDDVINDYKQKKTMLKHYDIGVTKRINQFFARHFESNKAMRVIDEAFSLDYYGLARTLSFAPNRQEYHNEYISSYRTMQGVLHNPKNDRRTTRGSFHIVEGNLAVPDDKKAVPKAVFKALYQAAVNPPLELLELPYTTSGDAQAHCFVSLYVRPIVAPQISGLAAEMSSEVLFMTPGSLVSNLDFVESVFGNAGDAKIESNDAALDLMGWTGHTGYVVLAPHLTSLTKKSLGLPPYSEASERQKRDGMCYKRADERYNDGVPFKITMRDHHGVAVTLIADNYFGYSKKEIKTQISFAANLFGGVEEEHAGGTIAYPRVNLGEHYYAVRDQDLKGYSFEEVKLLYAYMMDIKPQNYAVDKQHPHVIYLPENIVIDLLETTIRWQYLDETHTLTLRPTYYYVLPNGSKIHIEKHPAAPAWKLVKTEAEGLFCHKPCTVSGGGKSEISKSLDNAIIYGSYYVNNFDKAMNRVQKILDYDYSKRWQDPSKIAKKSRKILSVERTLGSVIKLLTPSSDYTAQYNQYIEDIPSHVKALVFMVKRFYQPEWGNDWRSHFSVDEINGQSGHEVNFNNRRIRPSYLRVGFKSDDAWRIFKLRMDFMPTEKIQMEDDISASTIVPATSLQYLNSEQRQAAYKFTQNCEYRFFQRPDDAVHKGYDHAAEADLAGRNVFITNFQPLDQRAVQNIKDDVMGYISYTQPMIHLIERFLSSETTYCVVSSEARVIDGKASKNPRYLENRKDFTHPLKFYLAEIGSRFARKVPLNQAVLTPVNAILPGRRNNPASIENGKRIRPLSVYNPLHYQELPELFADYISSLTGKSPSTTGAGSEGALTKAPFNMLLPIYDLNAALLSYILTGYQAFTTPAGYIGSELRVDHDISMLIPELWARLSADERNAERLIAEGSLEKIDDFTYQDKQVPASLLGYRITKKFVRLYMGKIFDEPQTVFTAKILRPEQQNMTDFVDGVYNIAEGHKKAAQAYFRDGSIDAAIPPLKALLTIMAGRQAPGVTMQDANFRKLFNRDDVLTSDWYRQRLENKATIDRELLAFKRHTIEHYLNDAIERSSEFNEALQAKKLQAEKLAEHLFSDDYVAALTGTLGADNFINAAVVKRNVAHGQ